MRRLLAIVLLLALGGCTKPLHDSDATSTAQPGATPLLTRAQLELSTRAGRASTATYDATYRLKTSLTLRPSTIRIVTLPPNRLRVDVTSGTKGTVSSYQIPQGTIDCKSDRTCVLVARPGEPIPEGFNPGVDKLFSSAADELGRNPAAFDVTELPARPARGRVPASRCYHVTRRNQRPGRADPTGFETGDYCFARNGIPTLLKVNYGTLTLVKLGPRPSAKLFVPPSKPIRLPDLTPTPSAS